MKLTSISRILISLLFIIIIISIIFIWNYQIYSQAMLRSDNCELSLVESNGFFCESNVLWYERKRNYYLQQKENMIFRNTSFFFLDNWTLNFHCSNARRMGNIGDGGKWVCDPYRLKIRHDCLIYSAGSNGEFSFEIGMKKDFPHCEIHTFDSNSHPYPNNTCTFHKIRLGDGASGTFSKNWSEIIHELNHTNRIIDILKIDIEGSEYLFFPLIFAWKESSYPRQILVEIHPYKDPEIHKFFKELTKNNYVIFSKEQNLLAGEHYFEYAFIRMNPRFFSLNYN